MSTTQAQHQSNIGSIYAGFDQEARSARQTFWKVIWISTSLIKWFDYRKLVRTPTCSPWIWEGVSATLWSGRYILSYPRDQHFGISDAISSFIWRVLCPLLKHTHPNWIIWLTFILSQTIILISASFIFCEACQKAQHWSNIGSIFAGFDQEARSARQTFWKVNILLMKFGDSNKKPIIVQHKYLLRPTNSQPIQMKFSKNYFQVTRPVLWNFH